MVRATTTTAPVTTTVGDTVEGYPHGVIVFDARWTTGIELHAMDLDARSDRRVGGDAHGAVPRFSPSGRQLAYSRSATEEADPDVFVVDVDGDHERKVAPGACPTWTKDGKALIVEGHGGLERIDLDGTTKVISKGTDGCGLEVGADRYVLWQQNESLQLLDHGKKQTLLKAPRCGIGPVDVDHADKRIAYTVACEADDDPHSGLWIMDLATGATKQLRDGNVYGASWSPDDSWIATGVGAKLPDGTIRHDLWTICTAKCENPNWKYYEGGVNTPTWGPQTSADK